MERLVEMKLDELEDGAFAISIVSNPAIESDFLALSDSKVLLKVENEEKRILTGAILIPNLPILRKDADGNPYHIFFSEDTVNEMSQRYLKNANQSNVTVEHEADVDNVTLTESWIKTDEVHDKSVALGIDVPTGAWLGTMKVDNDQLWDRFIKAGHLNGFSIEAKMKGHPVTNHKFNNEINMEATDTKNLVEHLKAFFKPEEKPAEEPTISRNEFVELCGKVDSLADTLKQALDLLTKEETVEAEAVVPEVEEPVEETKVEAQATEEAPVEEPKKEEVEMLAHTDAEEEIIHFSAPKFDYKLSTSERIAKAMKQF